ncbi:MAG: UDP-N-acetylmuramate dehydrogenase [Corynebacterium sp.]|nr:UDP-N-acetylmuramate dehydrogenase [Corynebacterium sp.]
MNTVRARLEKIPGINLDDAPLSTRTTLHVGGRPEFTVFCATEHSFIEAVKIVDEAGLNPLFLGGGSNLLIADGDLPYVAIVLGFSEIHVRGNMVTASAGSVWDAVVDHAVNAGLGGIECLSGIPGSTGAVPVQNVGAYGVEVSDILTQVKLLDRRTQEVRWVPASDLELAYRHSRLKHQDQEIVLAAEFKLTRDGLSAPIRFGELSRVLGAEGMERFDAPRVRKEVLALRAAKGMLYNPDDHDSWSAGSFFTNPVVPVPLAEEIGAKVDSLMPMYPVAQEDQVKLSAAWLIEQAGFPKGYPMGTDSVVKASLSTKHTLALTNRGTAKAEDIAALAREIRAGVQERFGVLLEPEPVLIGIEL